MFNCFMKDLIKETNWVKTNNGADALKSTTNDLVDLFGSIGAMRSTNPKMIIGAFSRAYATDRLLATKILFHTRNIRSGLGERDTFRLILHWLAHRDPTVVLANLANIATFGRYDDYYALVDTPIEKDMFAFLKAQFENDILAFNEERPISLLAKWLPSVNSHSKATRHFALLTVAYFNTTERTYRVWVAKLRQKLKIVESTMSRREWEDIDYSAVPSRAMSVYRTAFYRHDNERFDKFLNAVKDGTAKIHADTLYPYDIVKPYLTSGAVLSDHAITPQKVREVQWKALPNFVDGESNFLVVADTSGSMMNPNFVPISVSISLAIYFAERNHGAYKDTFITFSEKPSLIRLKGATLAEKVNEVLLGKWGKSTNIEAVFNLILKVAVDNHLDNAQLPKSVVIISDMQFDRCSDTRFQRNTFYDTMATKFAESGYTLPRLIFWNVNAGDNVVFHADINASHAQFISGASPSSFKALINGASFTAYDLMLMVLNDDRYNCVVLS